MQMPSGKRRIPLTVKVVYVLWISVWLPVYWVFNGPQNLLWLCDVANLILLFALCLESPLLMSSQAVGVLFVQVAWLVDFLSGWLLGTHPIGGTEYMFDASEPAWLRSMSLFHVVMPPLLLWGVYRLGYDRRGWKLETAIAWLLLPTTFLLTGPELNINWLWAPFGHTQTWMPPRYFLPVMMLAYPLILFFPAHLLLSRCFRPARAAA